MKFLIDWKVTNEHSPEVALRLAEVILTNLLESHMEATIVEASVHSDMAMISRKVYEKLLHSQLHLDLLIERGVDNWNGYTTPESDDADEEY